MPIFQQRTGPRLPGPISQRYENDQRRRLAEALMTDETPMTTTTQGLAGLAKALIGKRQMSRVDTEYQGQADDYNKTLAEAMKMYGTDPQAAIARLGQNPDFAEPAMKMQMDYGEQQAQAQREAARAAADAARYEARSKADADQWTRSEEARQRRFEEGQKNAERRAAERLAQGGQGAPASYGQPVEGIDPVTGQRVFVRFSKDGDQQIVAGVQPPTKAALTGKDLSTANAKVQAAQNLKRQLAEARAAFEKIKGTLAAGPVTGMNPFSEPGQQFDAAVDALRSTVTALTRTPGVGAMSDFETRLDQSKIPARGKYESVTAQQLDELEALADGIIGGYSDMLGPSAAPMPSAPGAGATGDWGNQPKGGAVKWGDL